MRPTHAIAALVLALTAGACGSATKLHPSSEPAPTHTRPSAASTGSMLPETCTATPHPEPLAPSPSWPAGYRILDALPSALASQFPTVYGGLKVAPAAPGQSPAEVNSHFIVFETVHDPALEAEATSAYRPPLSVTFQITSRSWVCLQDVQASISSALSKQGSAGRLDVAGASVYSWGLAVPYVVVGTTACAPQAVRADSAWFTARWGDAVQLQTCGQLPSAAALSLRRARTT